MVSNPMKMEEAEQEDGKWTYLEINNKMKEVMKLENKQLIKIYGNIDIIKYYNNTNYQINNIMEQNLNQKLNNKKEVQIKLLKKKTINRTRKLFNQKMH